MVTIATLIAVLVDVAIGSRALMRIASHEKADFHAHEEFRSRFLALEGASPPVQGFSYARGKDVN